MNGPDRDPGAEAPLVMSPSREAARRSGAPSVALVAGGVAIALGLGVAIGLVSRPELDIRGDAPPMQPASPEAARQAASPSLSVEVGEAVVPPAPPPAPPPPPAVFAPQGAPIAIGPRLAPRAPEAAAPPPARPAPEPAWAPEAPVAPEPRFAGDPSFDCRYARSASEQMVCDSPRLAAADRAMDAAYDRAIRAGAPPRWLRREQDDWLEIREDAARHSSAAVADVYDQRISELRAIARDAESGRLP